MIYELENHKPTFQGECYVAPNAAVIGQVVLGHNSSVWWNVTIRGDCDVITLGENVNVQDGSVLHADEGVPLTLHRNVSVGHMVMLHGCTILENTLVGIGAIILNRAVIGKNCIVGAGALVPEGKVIPDGSLVIGVPGRVLRQLTDEDLALNRAITRHYVDRAERYRKDLKAL